jgi:hypothetical protein
VARARAFAGASIVLLLRLAVGFGVAWAWVRLDSVAQRLGLFVGGPCATGGAYLFYLLVPVWFGLAAWYSGGPIRRLVLGSPGPGTGAA